MSNSVNPFLDKRYAKKNDPKQFLISMRVYMNAKQFMISMGLYANQADFDKIIGSRSLQEPLKELRKSVNDNLSKAQELLDSVPNIDADKFKRLYKMDGNMFKDGKTDLFLLFKEREDEFYKGGQYKSGRNIMSACRSLKTFKGNVFIEDVDERWLKDYKLFMENKGISSSTISMYLRSLRSVFNKARKDGVISEKHYPFKYFPIGQSAKSKDVLYPPQLKALWEYVPQGLRERRAKALFFFCYLCNGMNFKDAAYLKYKNIKGTTLTFVREKTKRTNTILDKEIRVYVSEEVRKIIDEWGVKDGKPDDYIFGIVDPKNDGMKNERRRNGFQRNHNRMLNNIGKKLGLDVDLCFNLARHSFATMLKLNKTPVAFISDAMGHASTTTTQHYLKSITTENNKEISDSLLRF